MILRSMFILAVGLTSLCANALAHPSSLVATPESLKYKSLALEDPTVPVSMIIHFNSVFKENGFSPMDEKNEGNIPFYWVDQIYLSPDLKRSVTLKLKVELDDRNFEGKLLNTGTNYAFHSRSKNQIPFAIYFSGFSSVEDVKSLVNQVKFRIDPLVADLRVAPTRLPSRLLQLSLPEAQAQCTSRAQLITKQNTNTVAQMEAQFMGSIFDGIKDCLVSALRSARDAMMSQVQSVGDMAASAGTAIVDRANRGLKKVKNQFNFMTGFFKDAFNEGTTVASAKASMKIENKLSKTYDRMSVGVQNAIAAVSEFPARIKEFIGKIWTGIKAAWASTMDTLLHHPEVLLQLLCKFIGSLAGSAALPALVTFLTGGAGAPELFAQIGTKILTWGMKLQKLGKLFELAAAAGKSGAALLSKIAGGMESVSEKVLTSIEKMTNLRLNKMALQAASCAF